MTVQTQWRQRPPKTEAATCSCDPRAVDFSGSMKTCRMVSAGWKDVKFLFKSAIGRLFNVKPRQFKFYNEGTWAHKYAWQRQLAIFQSFFLQSTIYLPYNI
jgi:hypothetical protein